MTGSCAAFLLFWRAGLQDVGIGEQWSKMRSSAFCSFATQTPTRQKKKSVTCGPPPATAA